MTNENNDVKMVSYWKEAKEICRDGEVIFIIGFYKFEENESIKKALGIHYENRKFPISRGYLTPFVIPDFTRDTLLSGLLGRAVAQGAVEDIKLIMEAIEFFKK